VFGKSLQVVSRALVKEGCTGTASVDFVVRLGRGRSTRRPLRYRMWRPWRRTEGRNSPGPMALDDADASRGSLQRAHSARGDVGCSGIAKEAQMAYSGRIAWSGTDEEALEGKRGPLGPVVLSAADDVVPRCLIRVLDSGIQRAVIRWWLSEGMIYGLVVVSGIVCLLYAVAKYYS
jgi:hypothetical protein